MNNLHLKPETWTAVISAVCAIVAVFIALRANCLSKKALQLSERSFAIDKRPFVTMNPVCSKQTGKYVNLTSNESGFVLELAYEVKNLGATPASNVSAPRILKLSGPKGWEFSDVRYGDPPRISLGPQEGLVMLLRADLKSSDSTAAKELLSANEEGRLVVTIGTALEYRSEHFPGTSFGVTATHRITKDRAETLAYDFVSKVLQKE